MTNGDNLSRSALFLFTHLSLDLRDLYSWLSASILKRSYMITQGTKKVKIIFSAYKTFQDIKNRNVSSDLLFSVNKSVYVGGEVFDARRPF